MQEKKVAGNLEKKPRDKKIMIRVDKAVWMFKEKLNWGAFMKTNFSTEELEEFEAYALS